MQTLWGLPLLTRAYGSALPRSLAPALISGLITGGLALLGDKVSHLWSHPFAYNAFVLLVSFALTFRSVQSVYWNRIMPGWRVVRLAAVV